MPLPHITTIDPGMPAVDDLLNRMDRYLAALYPAESNHTASRDALRAPGALFVGAWLGVGLAGCAAVLRRQEGTQAYGEIKRVFVCERQRGRGIADALMAYLEAHLQDQGITLARLETGVHQPEALALYRRRGYAERAPFGGYAPDPLSVFMEKRLAA